MSFFESLLALMLAAILLSQVSRRLGLPYPAMLAIAGVGVAFIPGAPTILIDPHTALALFIAPVLLDAAYDLPVGTAWKLWRPLFVLAVVSVLATAAVVAWIGWTFAGLPLAAAIVLGAIVAPPDAAAATAVLGTVSLPHRTITVLKGESLFNDATALLLFAGALAVQAKGSFDSGVALQIGIAVPGGILLGIAFSYIMRWLNRLVSGTLGGSLLQFVAAFLVWIIADRLHLSAVLAVVAFAMTMARLPSSESSPRMRVHSFAVWATVVFLLNVLAFLLMGMQARTIVGRMEPERIQSWAGTASPTIPGCCAVTLSRQRCRRACSSAGVACVGWYRWRRRSPCRRVSRSAISSY
jgi:NhaP-type Na+/H+ or K+/H+ antiporter